MKIMENVQDSRHRQLTKEEVKVSTTLSPKSNNNNNDGDNSDKPTTSNKRSSIILDHDSDKDSAVTQHSYQKSHKRKKRRKYIYVGLDQNNNAMLKSDQKGKENRVMSELLRGILIYAFCVSAPVIFGIIVKWYENYFVVMEQHNDDYYYYENTKQSTTTSPTSGTGGSFSDPYSSTSSSTTTTPNSSHSTSSFSIQTIYNLITKIIFNIENHTNMNMTTKVSTFLSYYSADAQFIIIAAIVQSIIRVILVHLLVPRYFVPKRFAAFVRNKSTHLLSSNVYEWSKENDLSNSFCEKNSGQPSNFNNNSGIRSSGIRSSSISNNKQPQNRRRELSKKVITQYVSDAWVSTGHSIRRSLGHETDATSPTRIAQSSSTRIDQNDFPKLPSLCGKNTRSSNVKRPTSRHDKNNNNGIDSTRIFAAPRFATAIFRLLCCTLSCVWALTHFRTASFWPVWVGGSDVGSTKHCWDLSGTVDSQIFVMKHSKQNDFNNYYEQDATINAFLGGSGVYPTAATKSASNNDSMDVDFDNQNSALRYFFLGQASYQLQSLCFHILSMILLLFYGGMKDSNNKASRSNEERSKKKEFIISARSTFKSYVRPCVEHSVYFILTISTFFFSALRRLGCICIFALEVSSLSVQLLQICINAPESSRLRNPHVIKFVHRYLAIPIFVYARFFILPFVVQYSSAFESFNWLRQIDHAFMPGCGRIIYGFFNGTLLFAFGLNFIYLRRLIFHPHVKDISSKTGNRD